MCSKLFLSLVMIVVIVSACARQRVSDQGPIVVTLGGASVDSECVTKIGDTVKSYVDGQLAPTQVGAFWDCLGNAVQKFQILTTGVGPGGAYEPQAILSFFTRHFALAHPINSEFLASLMQVKQVFLGGRVDSVTPQELIRLQTLIGQFKTMSLQLQPYVAILLRRPAQASDSDIEAASAALLKLLLQLGSWLNQQGQSYSFAALSQLITQVQQWDGAGSSSTFADLQTVVQTILPPVKAIFIGGDPTQISAGQWVLLANSIGKGYGLYVAGAYAFDSRWDVALLRDSLVESSQQMTDLLLQGAEQQPQGSISLAEWQALFVAVQSTRWLPAEFTSDAMNSLWLWVLQRPLGDGSSVPQGMNASHVAVLRHTLDNWAALLAAAPSDSSPLNVTFKKILADSPPMQWDTLGRITFPAHPPSIWSEDGRRRMIWPFALLNWLKTAYAGPTVDFVTMEQVNLAASEILPLLQNFGWFQTTKPTIGKRILREADLFTMASNGNLHLDMTEAVRYLALVASSYRAAQVWMDRAEQGCAGYAPACLRSLATAPNSDILTSLPRLKSLLTVWSPNQFLTYMQHAEATTLGAVKTQDFAVGDLVLVWQIFEYVEIFVQRYDTDFSETINLNESMAAFPVYSPTLNEIIGGGKIPQDQMLVFFTFMMKFGDKPDTMFGGMVAYNWWSWHRDAWAYTSDRDILMSILNKLAASW